jgi:hypothetical protein
MPIACAVPTADTTGKRARASSLGRSTFFLSRYAVNDSPTSRSIAMNGGVAMSFESSAAKASRMGTTLGCLMAIAARASRRKRRRRSGFSTSKSLRNLSAQLSSVSRCVAAQTDPMPPSPRWRSRRYRPAITAPAKSTEDSRPPGCDGVTCPDPTR